ncbi:serine hydrolase domain-containing protein [Microbacterium allomyrinae]|uniref:Beta-lactamase family protein n=1 Tax=Microbacterium allomyrinae TaxID=2830666 RepID=A0A9X1LT04_9MICO|nr:serine hydrolase domain-containing protein [Microbacterium allomyrinae]MCC2031504.1 beta-lactamase family protein [Microbacterium allomyrinae]
MNTDDRPLAATLRRFVDAGEVAGAALRFRQRGALVEEAVIGWADIERRREVTARSVFRQASLTKPVVAVAILQLVETGLVRLDDPVAVFIPSYASTMVAEGVPTNWSSPSEAGAGMRIVDAIRPVTIRDLLTHSSGLGHGPHSAGLIDAVRMPGQTLAERVDAYTTIPADAQPGESAGYSPQVGFDVLGRVVEVCTGVDLHSALRAGILDPLGMTDTTFVLTAEQHRRLVTLYGLVDGVLRDESASPDALSMTPVGLASGAAGLYGTAWDFDRFARMLGGGGELEGTRILKRSSVEAMSAERSAGARAMGHGLEWGLGVIVEVVGNDVKAPGAWGWSGAWGSHLVIDSVNRTTLVLMVNRSDIGGAGSAPSRELEQVALREYGRVHARTRH